MRSYKKLKIKKDDLDFNVYDWTTPNKNAPILFCVHGIFQQGFAFAGLAELAKEYRVIAPDIRGRGESSWGKPEHYIPDVYSEDMLYILQKMGLSKVIWVGTSLGGLTGMKFITDNLSYVKHFVMNDVGPEVSSNAMKNIAKYSKKFPIFDTIEAGEDWYKKYTYSDLHKTDSVLFKKMVNLSLKKTSKDKFSLHFDPMISKPLELFCDSKEVEKLNITMWAEFEQIACPITVIWGEKSLLLTKKLVDKMQYKSTKKINIICEPDVGHSPMLNKKETVNKLLELL